MLRAARFRAIRRLTISVIAKFDHGRKTQNWAFRFQSTELLAVYALTLYLAEASANVRHYYNADSNTANARHGSLNIQTTIELELY